MKGVLKHPLGLPDAPKEVVSDETVGGLVNPDKPDGNVQAAPGPKPLPPTLAELDLIAGIIGDQGGEGVIPVFLTSLKWAKVAREIAIYRGGANPDNFRRLIMRSVVFVNAQTEDQDAVNLANKPIAEMVEFASRRERLKSGYKQDAPLTLGA